MDSNADNNKVVNNIIKDQDARVSIGAWYISGPYAASADNNKVIHNAFIDVTTRFEDEGATTKVHANIYTWDF